MNLINIQFALRAKCPIVCPAASRADYPAYPRTTSVGRACPVKG